MSEISVQELRHGLFSISWKLKGSSMEVELVELCGSQVGQKLSISYNENFREAKKQKKKSYEYEYTILVEETSWDNTTSDDSQLSESSQVVEEMQRVQKQMYEVNKETFVKKKSADPLKLLKSEMSSPKHIWIKSPFIKRQYLPLVKVDSFKWKRVNFIDEQRDVLILCVDFGSTKRSERNIITGLVEMFNNQHRCDVQFKFINEQTIGAHSLILSAGSPGFAAMFQPCISESTNRQVTITDIKVEVFQQLLIHLYSGSAPKIEEENITQPLYLAAEKYDIETLKSDCIDVLLKKLDIDNAIEMLVWSHLHFIPKLFEFALKFLTDNRREICLLPKWLDFVRNHPELCALVTQRMVV
ncbi:hypothetical protein DAPPUDRAFT_222309 [Daphnia pulex]|uniref:BTB domain-containing protein n=1 Tax=Daphnia pulex TaxID=6669 RepID=E9G356_DAPPU|nr:hypothetical protein DAPPUDRAFT_222309 [Daphnia pulex]|eukprot:EFX86048.1 hypothetical protein DAPPUDRAFT_222309 [Daphnia pulex]